MSGKAGITRQDIARLLDRFYADARRDPLLGPIFARHIGSGAAEWSAHIGRIGDFWANVMLKERAYQGNPMQAHLRVPALGEAEFARWLDLFQQSAIDTLPEPKAAVFDTLARRIGASLLMGLHQSRSAVPDLKAV